jgi:hypothetical protein
MRQLEGSRLQSLRGLRPLRPLRPCLPRLITALPAGVRSFAASVGRPSAAEPYQSFAVLARRLTFQRSTYSLKALRTTSEAVALNPVSRANSAATRCAAFHKSSSMRTGLTGVFMHRLLHLSQSSSTEMFCIVVHYM